jgi:hypothetical protein
MHRRGPRQMQPCLVSPKVSPSQIEARYRGGDKTSPTITRPRETRLIGVTVSSTPTLEADRNPNLTYLDRNTNSTYILRSRGTAERVNQ